MAQAHSFELIVIGSGAAGGVAAQIAANEGHKVAIIESDKAGGATPNSACIPTKSLLTAASAYQSAKTSKRYGIRVSSVAYNYPSVLSWKEKVIKQTGVRDADRAYKHEHITYIQGTAQFINQHTIQVGEEQYSADKFLIATGSSNHIPTIDGMNEPTDYITSNQALELKSPPKSLIIVGGGATGVEFAELFNSFGTNVTLVERETRLLPKEDKEVGVLVESSLSSRGVTVLTGTTIEKFERAPRNKKVLTMTKGAHDVTSSADEILITTGREANIDLGLDAADISYDHKGIVVTSTMQTSKKHIFAAGDVTGKSKYTHVSTYQARIAAHNMFHKDKVSAHYGVIPRTVYSWPEVAAVGLTEEQLPHGKTTYRSITLPISVTARSMITGEDVGFVRIHASSDGTIAGASIVAPRATDMIAELVLAMQHGIKVQDIANTLHAFPSWSDAVRVACSQF